MAATFAGFTPGVTNTYAASTTANVISTMPNALLAVVDQSTTNAGFLVNSGTPLASRLRSAGDERGDSQHRVQQHHRDAAQPAVLGRPDQ